MNKRKLFIPLLRWRRVSLTALLSAFVAVVAQAQPAGESQYSAPRDQNSELRSRTWSIYAEGGLSWATDVWYQNLDAKRSYQQSPAVGGGVDFTIRPWIRVGAEYLYSNYRREQRFSQLDSRTMPVKAYGNYLMNYHNAKLGLGFNIMELWPRRHAQWLNIWAGTGGGYSFGKGNEYGIYFSNTMTQGGQTTPFTGNENVSNDGSITITGKVQTTNRHEKFNTVYIPASLHIEADVNRRFTVGLKGEMDYLLNRKDIAPKNLIFALATVRYNFVPSRAKAQRTYYERKLSALNDRVGDLQRKTEHGKSAAATMQPSHFVQFDHNSSFMSSAEAARLKAFAGSVKGRTLTLVAEASTPGSSDYNQALSERRLVRVVEALVKEGFDIEDLHPMTAIGEQEGKPSAEGRRVTITVE